MQSAGFRRRLTNLGVDEVLNGETAGTNKIDDNINLQWCVARRPVGNVQQDDFLQVAIPECADQQILLRTLFLNLAPVMRMYMLGEDPTGEGALEIGDVIRGRGVAEVIESRHPDFDAGDVVQGQIGWQTYKVSSVTASERIIKIPDRGVSYGLSLGPLGMTGFSAYFGFLDRGKPLAGETVVVSGAAGGVGSIVIQLAKIHGCRVIGIAGGSEKCQTILPWCDATIDYHNDPVADRLAELLPKGLDIYFDNVGGDILSACLNNLAFGARVVLCGSISEYMLDEPYGLNNYAQLRNVNSSMNGFFVYNYTDQFSRAEADLANWVRSGELSPMVDVIEGFEAMPQGLARLYSHQNIGSAYCRVR